MSDSQSHQMDDEPIIYEQQEVLWAKIRGYPWWPAFVDKVHGANTQNVDQIEYTVFFFGDNTHSRLEASKLRRFLDYYTEFFPKAKTNRKLYLSIMKAEQKLKQNGGNIEIFQTLRNSLKKSKKGRGNHRTQSRIDSEDNVNNLSQEPQLVRNRTFPNHDRQQNSQEIIIAEQQKKTKRRRGRKAKKVIEDEQKQNAQKMVNDQQKQSQDLQKQIQQQIINYRTRSGRPRNQQSRLFFKNKSQKSNEQKQSQSSSQNEQVNKKNYPLRGPPKTKIINRNAPKKRGRPKKVVQQPQNSQSQQSHQQLSENSENKIINESISQTKPKNQGRKTRLQRNVSTKSGFDNQQLDKQKSNFQIIEKPQISQEAKQLILERVKFCLDKRTELVEYLDELNITTDIVQQILDLNVSPIIQQKGQQTQQSIRVLHKLRSVLLHKYFPEDIKIRKKYQKLNKKAQSLKTNLTENEESMEDLELRRKTLIKLQKILKSVQNTSDEKQKAIGIQSFFRKYDESIGTGYRTMAYKVLRALKDKQFTVEQVISRLESGEYDEQIK